MAALTPLTPACSPSANRAFAQLKVEAFGLAIADADKAIELNPKYAKVGACAVPRLSLLRGHTVRAFSRASIGAAALTWLWGSTKTHVRTSVPL